MSEEAQEMDKCPVCDLEIAASDIRGQIAHMESQHPEYLVAKLKREGLWNYAHNRPLYPKENDPLTSIDDE